MKKTNKKGFTLVELVIVIAVIGVLSAILVPTFSNIIQNANDSKSMQTANTVYKQFLINNVTEGNFDEYYIFETNENRFVSLKNGQAIGVYDNNMSAIGSLVANPEDYVVLQTSTDKLYQILNLSGFKGKKIACIGDSVTAGVGANPNYVQMLGEILNTTPINLGISGTVLSQNGHRSCQITRLTDSYLKGADVVTIYLGVNDWDQAVKDGYFNGVYYESYATKNGGTYYTLGELGSNDTSTIYGATKMWCEKIMELKATEKYKDTKFFFITPHITSWNNSASGKNWDQTKLNVHGFTLRDLCNAIIEVCATYDIPVIDVNSGCGIYYNNVQDNNVNLYGGDGIHPNVEGHKLITNYILRKFAETNNIV